MYCALLLLLLSSVIVFVVSVFCCCFVFVWLVVGIWWGDVCVRLCVCVCVCVCVLLQQTEIQRHAHTQHFEICLQQNNRNTYIY